MPGFLGTISSTFPAGAISDASAQHSRHIAIPANLWLYVLLFIGFVIFLLVLPVIWGVVSEAASSAAEKAAPGTFFLGLGGANFVVYSFWLPEQYATDCRVSAFAFTTNVGRFAGAGLTFLVGAMIRHYGTLGTPVALTSIAFIVGLLLLPFGAETRGKSLPA